MLENKVIVFIIGLRSVSLKTGLKGADTGVGLILPLSKCLLISLQKSMNTFREKHISLEHYVVRLELRDGHSWQRP